MTLSSLPCNQILNESPLSWHSFQLSYKASSAVTLTTVTTDTDISGSQSPCMFPDLPWFLAPSTNFNGDGFPTKIGLSVYKLSFVNSIIVWWSFTLVASAGCAYKYFSANALSASFSLHDFVPFLYHEIISHSHIILAVWCHITNWCCKICFSIFVPRVVR